MSHLATESIHEYNITSTEKLTLARFVCREHFLQLAGGEGGAVHVRAGAAGRDAAAAAAAAH